MINTELIHSLIQQTSRYILAQHCRLNAPSSVQLIPLSSHPDLGKILSERTSSIVMMGGPGRIVLRNQFNFDTALSWMTSRDPLASPIDTEKASLDFMREYSNLHAGILRASFERCGILFGVSLPQIMTGELKRSTTQLSGARSTLSEWILTDGKLHIVSTAEIDIVDSGKFEAARATLDSELLREQAKANSGTFDSTGFEFF